MVSVMFPGHPHCGARTAGRQVVCSVSTTFRILGLGNTTVDLSHKSRATRVGFIVPYWEERDGVHFPSCRGQRAFRMGWVLAASESL